MDYLFTLDLAEEETETKAEEASSKPKAKPIRNQFNFGERSAQTVNQLMREQDVQTEPPPRERISVTVNQ